MENDLLRPILKDLHLRLTNKCNFNCTHCYAATDRFIGMELEFEKIKKIILELEPIGLKKTTLTGGEPLLYSNIIPLIDFLLEKNIKIVLETNGSKLDTLYNKLDSELNRVSIIVSYDPPEIRGEENTKKVYKNLRLLHENEIDFATQTTITKQTNNIIENLLTELIELKPMNARFFLNFDRIGRGKYIKPMNYQEASKIKKLIETKSSLFTVVFPGIFDGCMSDNCGWGFDRCEIMPNGDITSCAPITFFDKDFVAGNIYRDNFLEIWYNSKHFNRVRSFTQESYEYPCNICPEFNNCRGACRAIGYSCYGKLLGTFPYCKEYYEEVKTSFILVKPDAVEHIEDIKKDLGAKEIKVVFEKQLYLSDEEFRIIYSRLDKEFKSRLKIYIQSGPVILLVVHSESDTIKKVVNIVGETITTVDEWVEQINSNVNTLRVKYSSMFFDVKKLKYRHIPTGIPKEDLVIANGFHRPLDPKMIKLVLNTFLTEEERKLIRGKTNDELQDI